jgi:hypothetical protein
VASYRPRVLRFNKEGKYAFLVVPRRSWINSLIAELLKIDPDEAAVIKRYDSLEDALEIPAGASNGDDYIAELVSEDPEKGLQWKTLYAWVPCGKTKPESGPCTCGWVKVDEANKILRERRESKTV